VRLASQIPAALVTGSYPLDWGMRTSTAWPCLQVTALVPLFAVLDPELGGRSARRGDALQSVVALAVPRVHAALSGRQLARLRAAAGEVAGALAAHAGAPAARPISCCCHCIRCTLCCHYWSVCEAASVPSALEHAPGCCLLHNTTEVMLPGLQRPKRRQGPCSAHRTLAPLLAAATVIRQTRLPAQRRPLRAPSPESQALPPARQAAAAAEQATAAAATAPPPPPPLAASPPWRLAQ
jgi:hypothetical protein